MKGCTSAIVFLLALLIDHSSSAGGGYKPTFQVGQPVELFVWISESTDVSEQLFAEKPTYHNTSNFGWDITLDAVSVNVSVPLRVRQNRTTLYAHVFFCKKNVSPNPWESRELFDKNVAYRNVKITRHMPEIVKPVLRNLLFDPVPVKKEVALPGPKKIFPYWAPRLAVFVVTDENVYPQMSQEYVSPFLLQILQYTHGGIDHQDRTYMPIVHVDELGTLSKDLLSVNESAVQLPLSIALQPLGTTRYEWMLKMEHSVQMHREMGTPESEMEEVRRMFVETNSYLLITTMVVSVVHLLFDVLAFKNDISFWNGLETTKGISVRSIVVSTFMEVIVLLYLLDNETSFLVLFTVGGGLLVNIWKVVRAWKLMSKGAKEVATAKEQGKDKGKKVIDDQAVSREIDRIATVYLLSILGPPIVGYAAYSLIYENQKGWYSWALLSGVNVVYAVGFMMMTPQLFLNYKYKSVEFLPWRALIYRALNTFIDDLFAFVIHMPGLHRMSVFRDDIVFFIYLYQRWIYRNRKQRPATEAVNH